jgi:hypothetical protein
MNYLILLIILLYNYHTTSSNKSYNVKVHPLPTYERITGYVNLTSCINLTLSTEKNITFYYIYSEAAKEEDYEYKVNKFCLDNSLLPKCCIDLNTIVIDRFKTFLYDKRNYRYLTTFEPKEITQSIYVHENSKCMSGVEDCIFDVLYSTENQFDKIRKLFNIYSPQQLLDMQHVLFIHSCYIEEVSNKILQEYLEYLEQTGALFDFSMIWVINHGHKLPSSLISQFKSVQFVHFSNDISRFELPTLLVLQHFCKMIEEIKILLEVDPNQYLTKILYIHTKGLKYFTQPIVEWRNYMLYNLIEKRNDCHHLLESGLYDALGVDFVHEIELGN